MDHDLRPIHGEYIFQGRLIRAVRAVDLQFSRIRLFCDLRQVFDTILLERYRIIVIEIIEDRYIAAASQQSRSCVHPDKPGAAGDEYSLHHLLPFIFSSPPIRLAAA